MHMRDDGRSAFLGAPVGLYLAHQLQHVLLRSSVVYWVAWCCVALGMANRHCYHACTVRGGVCGVGAKAIAHDRFCRLIAYTHGTVDEVVLVLYFLLIVWDGIRCAARRKECGASGGGKGCVSMQQDSSFWGVGYCVTAAKTNIE